MAEIYRRIWTGKLDQKICRREADFSVESKWVLARSGCGYIRLGHPRRFAQLSRAFRPLPDPLRNGAPPHRPRTSQLAALKSTISASITRFINVSLPRFARPSRIQVTSRCKSWKNWSTSTRVLKKRCASSHQSVQIFLVQSQQRVHKSVRIYFRGVRWSP